MLRFPRRLRRSIQLVLLILHMIRLGSADPLGQRVHAIGQTSRTPSDASASCGLQAVVY